MDIRETKFCVFCICIICLLTACSSHTYPGDRCTDSRRRNGVCKRFGECPSAQQDLRKGVRPSNCGFAGNHPIVCCISRAPVFIPIPPPQPQVTSPPVRKPGPSSLMSTLPPEPQVTSPPAREPGARAKRWCEEYSQECPFSITVVGGTPAEADEFPHMAAVGYGPQNNIQWKCGGSLISEKFVLTAAHCLRGGNAGPAQWVLLGTVNLAANETSLGNKGQIHGVVRRIRHPGYKPPAKYDDIALLEIGPALTKNPRPLITEKLHPACLNTDDRVRHPSYIATGWGRTGFGEDPSLELLKVELDVFDEAKCNETFETEIRTTAQLRRGIDSTMLCAGILSGGKDTCQGDSGGPLQYPSSGKCQYRIWGITSFGKICSFANSPSIYMKVSAYIGWIEDNVWPS